MNLSLLGLLLLAILKDANGKFDTRLFIYSEICLYFFNPRKYQCYDFLNIFYYETQNDSMPC